MRVRLLVFAVVVAALVAASPASAAIRWESLHATARYAQIGSASPAGKPTIPYFTNSFTYKAQTYTYSMVGTDPAGAPATTTVPVQILPIAVRFADGTTLNGATVINRTTDSPLFQRANFLSGRTQYGDAIQRAEFWRAVANTRYHVLLQQPTTLPTATVNVPANHGVVAVTPDGKTAGLVNVSWWNQNVVQRLIVDRGLSGQVLPIFLTKNILLYIGKNPNNCCIIGYHGARNDQARTFVWGSYLIGQFYPPQYGITDVNPLSHEIAEWYNDPFVNNIVPAWYTPTAPQYGCTNYLETGDPLVGIGFHVNGYSLQDEAFLSWFARDVPSQGIAGRYTYLGTFDTPARGCS